MTTPDHSQDPKNPLLHRLRQAHLPCSRPHSPVTARTHPDPLLFTVSTPMGPIFGHDDTRPTLFFHPSPLGLNQLLLELPIEAQSLAQEMQSGLVSIARPDHSQGPKKHLYHRMRQALPSCSRAQSPITARTHPNPLLVTGSTAMGTIFRHENTSPTLCFRPSPLGSNQLLPDVPIQTLSRAQEMRSVRIAIPNHSQDPKKPLFHRMRQALLSCSRLHSPIMARTHPDPLLVTGSAAMGTIFGHKSTRPTLCLQPSRLGSNQLFLDLPIQTQSLAQEMQSGLVRIALQCTHGSNGSEPLGSVQIWTMFLNGRKMGFALRREMTEHDWVILNAMKSMSIGAGVVSLSSSEGECELMYMRARFEHKVGSKDTESYHILNPNGSGGYELSVFLIRSG
ncbi:hypothetical protein AMTR_s00012p00265590 [Amborella trichopoda]|uniref:Protein MIZU-KUSSEI 1 n=1 Tax=Amborella trichopoda TaxID=13333 RepID=W1PLQ6_AMBTC|nr:hypothetical protein AMTR_s00012p00265590 [Amborella trichopoda]